MGFVIQWLVYLVAFLAGSTVAYGIVALFIKTSGGEPETAAPEPEPSPAGLESAEPEPESQSQSSESEIGASG